MSDEIQNQDEVVYPPSMQEICIEYPLYKEIDIDIGQVNTRMILSLLNYTGTIDCYCINCSDHSVFNCKSNNQINQHSQKPQTYANCISNKELVYEFHCARNAGHKYFFNFVIRNQKLIKIGQFPSLSDLVKPDLKKYSKVLGTEYYPEFNRAIGLASHDIGIGAFVYLRRVFESLIEKAHIESLKISSWNEEDYEKKEWMTKSNYSKIIYRTLS